MATIRRSTRSNRKERWLWLELRNISSGEKDQQTNQIGRLRWLGADGEKRFISCIALNWLNARYGFPFVQNCLRWKVLLCVEVPCKIKTGAQLLCMRTIGFWVRPVIAIKPPGNRDRMKVSRGKAKGSIRKHALSPTNQGQLFTHSRDNYLSNPMCFGQRSFMICLSFIQGEW